MSDPMSPRDDDSALAAEYALGLTPASELTETRRRAASDAAFSAHVVMWQERLVAMTDDIDPVSPAPRIKKAVMARLFMPARVPLLQRVWLWQGVSIAALALAAFLGYQQMQPIEPVPQAPVFATQLSGADGALQVLAVFDSARGDLALSRTAGDALPGRVLELWAIAPDQAPVSLGVLPEQSTTRVALPEALAGIAGQLTLAISDEPIGGSPTGAPTGDVLAAAPVTEL